MPQKLPKAKHANDNARIIKTPEGHEIEITAGRKLQEIRAFARDPDITDAQFRALVCVVDRLNEGKEGTDEALWGSAYPTPETLAKDIAKDERAARRIVKELKDGQREMRSKNKERKLVPCKAALIVENRKTADGHDDFNLIRLRSWGAFVVGDRKRDMKDAPSGGGRSPAENEQQAGGGHLLGDGGHLSEVNRSPDEDKQVTAPDSAQVPHPETQPKNTTQAPPASGGPAVGSDDDPQLKQANDNQLEGWSEDWRDQFWNAIPERNDVKATERALIAIAATGVKLEAILIAARRKARTEKEGFRRNLVKWLADEPWKDNHKPVPKRPEIAKPAI